MKTFVLAQFSSGQKLTSILFRVSHRNPCGPKSVFLTTIDMLKHPFRPHLYIPSHTGDRILICVSAPLQALMEKPCQETLSTTIRSLFTFQNFDTNNAFLDEDTA